MAIDPQRLAMIMQQMQLAKDAGAPTPGAPMGANPPPMGMQPGGPPPQQMAANNLPPAEMPPPQGRGNAQLDIGGMSPIETDNYLALKAKGFDQKESLFHATNPPGRLMPGVKDPWSK